MNLASVSHSQGRLGPRKWRQCFQGMVAALTLAVMLAPTCVAQTLTIRADFDSAANWINAAPPGATLPEHTTSIVTDGANSAWQWEIAANQPDSFLVGLPLAEMDPNLNELLTPLADNAAQAKFHVDGGQPDQGLGVQVAIVSRFSTGSLDLPQGYCLLVGDGRLDLARFDFNGPPEAFEVLSSLEADDFIAAGGFDINPDVGEVDVIMRLDVMDEPDGSASLGGWMWDASTTPDTSFFDTPMIVASHNGAFPAGVLGLEARPNSTTEPLTVAFDWIEATGVVPEPNGLALVLVGVPFMGLRFRNHVAPIRGANQFPTSKGQS